MGWERLFPGSTVGHPRTPAIWDGHNLITHLHPSGRRRIMDVKHDAEKLRTFCTVILFVI